jgi:hypothetical protein
MGQDVDGADRLDGAVGKEIGYLQSTATMTEEDLITA